jgi:molybdate transport system substrate-binding protein
LESEGLGVVGSRVTYAIGTLVLWSPRADLVDAEGKVLRSDRIRVLAIADPSNAPYGAAAQQVLTAQGLWDQFNREHKLATGQDINQAWQFAATGNADMAFIAKSQLNAATRDNKAPAGSAWEPPQSQYTEIDQDGIILVHSSKRPAAETFMHWLRADKQALAAIEAAGYRVTG